MAESFEAGTYDGDDRQAALERAAGFLQIAHDLDRMVQISEYGGVLPAGHSDRLASYAVSTTCQPPKLKDRPSRSGISLILPHCLDPEAHDFTFYLCDPAGFADPDDAPYNERTAYFQESMAVHRSGTGNIPSKYRRLVPQDVAEYHIIFGTRYIVALDTTAPVEPVMRTQRLFSVIDAGGIEVGALSSHEQVGPLGEGSEFERMKDIAIIFRRMLTSQTK